MFWAIRRLLIGCFFCCLAGVAFYLYTQRELFRPAFDYGELWIKHDRDAPEELPLLSGQVTRIYSGASFQLKDRYGYSYVYGLAGVVPPATNDTATPTELRLAGGSWTNLYELLMKRDVEIRVTQGNPDTRTGLGVVRTGGTNVNLQVLSSGWGRVNREQIRGLPVSQQYEILKLERTARNRHLGIWSTNVTGVAAE